MVSFLYSKNQLLCEAEKLCDKQAHRAAISPVRLLSIWMNEKACTIENCHNMSCCSSYLYETCLCSFSEWFWHAGRAWMKHIYVFIMCVNLDLYCCVTSSTILTLIQDIFSFFFRKKHVELANNSLNSGSL